MGDAMQPVKLYAMQRKACGLNVCLTLTHISVFTLISSALLTCLVCMKTVALVDRQRLLRSQTVNRQGCGYPASFDTWAIIKMLMQGYICARYLS